MVAIIGVLAAVAIPAYNTYQDRAKQGVSESVLHNAARTVDVQRSLNETTTSTILGTIKSKGTNLDATAFEVYGTSGGTAAVGTIGTTLAWCISFNKSKVGTESASCIDSTGNIYAPATSPAIARKATGATCGTTGECA